MNLNQVTIPSKNLENAVIFYKLLGLKLIVDAQPRYVRFECPDGDTTFSIHLVEVLAKDHGVTVYFEENHLEACVEKLIESGLTFTQLPTNMPWLWREAHLYDPDGNRIILFKASENRKNPPWRIK